jgi:hypothetical protein
VECLLDLHEARLEAQASQFLGRLETRGKAQTVVRGLLDED